MDAKNLAVAAFQDERPNGLAGKVNAWLSERPKLGNIEVVNIQFTATTEKHPEYNSPMSLYQAWLTYIEK